MGIVSVGRSLDVISRNVRQVPAWFLLFRPLLGKACMLTGKTETEAARQTNREIDGQQLYLISVDHERWLIAWRNLKKNVCQVSCSNFFVRDQFDCVFLGKAYMHIVIKVFQLSTAKRMEAENVINYEHFNSQFFTSKHISVKYTVPGSV